jgi:hypothetical protein
LRRINLSSPGPNPERTLFQLKIFQYFSIVHCRNSAFLACISSKWMLLFNVSRTFTVFTNNSIRLSPSFLFS